jgi:putative sigma-54 modulation protein
MRLVLTGRNVDVTPALRALVTRRLAKLERLIGDAAVSAQVVLTVEKYRCITDMALHTRGDYVLSTIGTAASWPLSVRDAVDRIEQQAKRVKEKWTTRKRRAVGGKRVEPPAPAPPPAPELEPVPQPRVIRARHAVRPMDLADAVARLDQGAENFLMFRNQATGRLNVVVRRRDGNVGLIEPEA